MSEQNERQLEYEFVMEGITTRMQIALEKMADSNRMMSETNKRLCGAILSMCVMTVLVALIVAAALIVNNHPLTGTNTNHSEVVTYAGAESAQTLPKPGS